VHTLGTGQSDQVNLAPGDTFIGAPGAILSGQRHNNSAFDGTGTDITIKYLTIEDFTPPGSEGAVNHDTGEGWVISHNTIQGNSPGAGMMIGGGDSVTSNCLTKNGGYGFNAFQASPNGISSLTDGLLNITLSDNEISFNDTRNNTFVSNT
jgi:hypothetical protein